MKKGKILKTLAIAGTCLCAPLLLSGCTSGNENKTDFRVYDGYIQVTKDGTNWENLVDLDTLKGLPGDDGDDGVDADVWTIGNDGYWYKNGNPTNYKAKGDAGTDGNGIKSITKDDVNSTKQKTIYIIELDNGTKYSFEVVNGLDGAKGEDGDDTIYSTYTITYDYQTADENELFDNVKSSQQLKSTEWLTEIPQPKDQFKEFFDGWYIKETNKKIENYDFIGGDVTLEAHWLENTFAEQNCLEFTYNTNQDAYNCKIDLSQESVIVPSLYNGTKGYKKVININSNYDKVDVHELRDVYLPLSLKRVNSRAFTGCTYLTNIEIPKGVLSIGDNAFQGCTNLLNVTIPNSVTEIGAFAFSGCIKLKNVEIPNSVITMGNSYYGYVFEDCVNIETIYLPENLTRIESGLFSGCVKLKYIHIPEGVEYIGSNAFEDCSKLLELILPNSVKHIGFAAFRRCQSLTNIIIPQNVESFGQESLYNCENMMLVIVDSSIIANDMSSIYIARVKSDCIIYIKEGLTVSNADKFVKQESSDKYGYEMYLIKSENE